MTVYRCPACGTHEVAYGPLYYEGQRAKDHAVCLLCPWEGDMVQLSTKEGNRDHTLIVLPTDHEEEP